MPAPIAAEDKLSDVPGVNYYYRGSDGKWYCYRGEQRVDGVFNVIKGIAPTGATIGLDLALPILTLKLRDFATKQAIKRHGAIDVGTMNIALFEHCVQQAIAARVEVPNELVAAFSATLKDTGERFGVGGEKALLAMISNVRRAVSVMTETALSPLFGPAEATASALTPLGAGGASGSAPPLQASAAALLALPAPPQTAPLPLVVPQAAGAVGEESGSAAELLQAPAATMLAQPAPQAAQAATPLALSAATRDTAVDDSALLTLAAPAAASEATLDGQPGGAAQPQPTPQGAPSMALMAASAVLSPIRGAGLAALVSRAGGPAMFNSQLKRSEAIVQASVHAAACAPNNLQFVLDVSLFASRDMSTAVGLLTKAPKPNEVFAVAAAAPQAWSLTFVLQAEANLCPQRHPPPRSTCSVQASSPRCLWLRTLPTSASPTSMRVPPRGPSTSG